MSDPRFDQLQRLLRQGFVALAEGRIAEAGECCRQVLTLKPDLVQGHFLVGLVALEAHDRENAFRAFASVTKLQPGHAAAWAHLARLYMTDGQVNRADAALSEAIKLKPEEPIVADLLGSVYSLMGEHGLASDWFTKAVGKAPKHPGFLLNLANNQVYNGELEPAEDTLRRLLAIQPNSPQAHWSLSGLRRATDDDHIVEMRSLLGQVGDNPRLQAFFHYGIGKELEDLGRWEDAFEAFSAGASARRRTVEYDEAAEIEMFDFLAAHFDQDWLGKGVGNDSPAPIFVLGQPRTGTTLIERIISSHSDVHSAGELQQFSLAVRRLSDYRDPKRFSAAFFAAALDVDSEKTGTLYLESSRRMRGDTPRFVDKLPQNYLLIPLILRALPNAKIIHLTRGAMDACFASFKQLFADAYLHSYDLGEMARHHCRYRHLMGIWRDRFPDRFLDVSYEDTVQDLDANARRMLDYLELPWQDECLQFHEQRQAVSTASAVQVREPVHTRSLGRWRRYETQLAPLRAELEQAGHAFDELE